MANKLSQSELLKQIHDTVESLRVFINNDGGDLSFVSFKDGILKLSISGACVGCASFSMTFDQGVKEVFLTEFQGYIKNVQFIINPKKLI
ncbi:MAG: NifU family protein [Mycoplasmataceae bacterium]|jgi:Fe-S cluster biogenesis protein NfuA|nr:NifU family protein [Mycoplasmataceae bacterium]